MQTIIDVFSYINQLGASVMMPIILTIIGVVLGAKFGKALRGGLTVGIGFIGLNLVTGLMGENLAPAVQQMAQRFGLALSTVDIGWPAASAIAFGTTIGLIIIPIGLIVNIVMLLTNTTQTLDVDIWNYWHFAFTGSLIYALDRLNDRGLLSKGDGPVSIGQGCRGKTGKTGIGRCTELYENSLGGCPPKAVDMVKFLEEHWVRK